LKYYFNSNLPYAANYDFRQFNECKINLLESFDENRIQNTNFDSNESEVKKVGVIRDSFQKNYELEISHWALNKLSKMNIHIFFISFNQNIKFDHCLEFENNTNTTYISLDRECLGENIEKIRSLQIDLLINTTFISGRFFNDIARILIKRVARRQAMLLGEICTSGIRNVDYFFTAEHFKGIDGQFVEKIIPIKSLNLNLSCLLKEQTPITKRFLIRKTLKVESEELIFISNAHFKKIGPDCLAAWCSILKEIPESKMVLMPFPNTISIKYKKKFTSILKNACFKSKIDPKRFLITKVSGDEAFELLSAGDIFLDTFPYNGSISILEALNQSLPVVTHRGILYRNQFASEQLEVFGLKNLIAYSNKEYTEIAINLGKSKGLIEEIKKNLSEAISEKLKKKPDSYSDLADAVTKLI
jgi:predicted O-linked N-acetylglucosamine transferase (SPINDLY family)